MPTHDPPFLAPYCLRRRPPLQRVQALYQSGMTSQADTQTGALFSDRAIFYLRGSDPDGAIFYLRGLTLTGPETGGFSAEINGEP